MKLSREDREVIMFMAAFAMLGFLYIVLWPR